MRILIVNDDGIDAPGLKALVDQFKDKHEVYVVAPMHQQSGMSHSTTYFLHDLIAVPRTMDGAKEAWAITGTPADCVYVGLNELVKKPDIVISGINNGSNTSTDALYSGTLGAASEALINEIPAMAVSLCSYTSTDFACSAELAEKYLPLYLKDPDRTKYVFSINIPDLPRKDIKGVRVTHFDGLISYARPMQRTVLEDGSISFHSENGPTAWKNEGYDPEGDVTATKEGYVSITPIGLDMVRHEKLEELKKLVKES